MGDYPCNSGSAEQVAALTVPAGVPGISAGDGLFWCKCACKQNGGCDNFSFKESSGECVLSKGRSETVAEGPGWQCWKEEVEWDNVAFATAAADAIRDVNNAAQA